MHLDEEEVMVWQNVLDEILAGRPNDIECPFCGTRPLAVTETGSRTRVVCNHCGKYIEGSFGAY